MKAAAWRWREALVGLGVVLLFAWMAAVTGALTRGVALAGVLCGVGLLLAGLQRGRFRLGEDGPGIVRADEGRIGYMGPLSGGMVDIEQVARIDLDHDSFPPVWLLHQPGQGVLAIPVTAQGVEVLFDAFAGLPDFPTQQMLAELRGKGPGRVLIWRRQARLT